MRHRLDLRLIEYNFVDEWFVLLGHSVCVSIPRMTAALIAL